MDAESGFGIDPVYTGPPDGFDPASALGAPGSFPYTRGVYPTMYTTRPWTMRQYAGLRHRRGVQRALPPAARRRHDGPVGRVRPAHPDGVRLRRRRSRTARSARSAWRSTRSTTCGALFDGIPLDQVSTSMTINAPGRGAAAALPAGRRGAGRAGGPADRHDPERHPQGVHRPRDVHLPAEAVAAAGRRHVRLLPGRDPEVEHHLDLRLPHGRGRRDARAGDRVHPGQRRSSTSGRDRRRASTVDDFAPRLSFFFVARTTLLEEIAKFRAARRMWARIMRDEFGARTPSR